MSPSRSSAVGLLESGTEVNFGLSGGKNTQKIKAFFFLKIFSQWRTKGHPAWYVV
jgi:hypothetical protein